MIVFLDGEVQPIQCKDEEIGQFKWNDSYFQNVDDGQTFSTDLQQLLWNDDGGAGEFIK